MKQPDFSHEKKLWDEGYTVLGIDEVGRGAFAGPMYIAGVIFPNNMSDETIAKLETIGINDSKLLTAKKRELLSETIKNGCLDYSVVSVSVEIINQFGIGKATQIGMSNVVKNISKRLESKKLYALTDAFSINSVQKLTLSGQKPITRGDQISLSIAAASIIAKVSRDSHMKELSTQFPEYFLDKNKGYGTRLHRQALVEHGPSLLHRIDFIRKTLKSVL